MALKATIFKATLELSDLDRQVYGEHVLTIARHPSETDERMIIRLLAFALNLPADDTQGPYDFAKDLWEADEPAIWQKDYAGAIEHWIEIGQPDDKRLMKVCNRVGRVSVYAFSASVPIWWADTMNQITRAKNLTVWQIPAEQSQALAGLAQRAMQLQVTVQDGSIWVAEGATTIEVAPVKLYPR